MKNKLFFLILILVLSDVHAEERDFVAEISSESTSPGRQVELSLILPSDIYSLEMPFLPGIVFNFKDKYIDKEKSTVTYKYSVIPSQTGSYRIGPLIAAHDGVLFKSNQVVLNVEKDKKHVPERKVSVDMDLAGHIFAEIEVPKKNIYVNEKVPVKLYFYSDWLDIEDLKVSETSAKENIIGGKIEQAGSYVTEKDGIKYVVVEYIKDIFFPFPGRFTIDPFKFRFNIVRPNIETTGEIETLNDNFDLYEKYLGRKQEKQEELRTSPVDLNIIDLPPDKPIGFNGAVGDFDVEMEVDRSAFMTDNIINVTTVITGNGNYATVSSPEYTLSEGIKGYPVIVSKNKNSVTFEQKVKVEENISLNMPFLRFVFFSPAKKEYVVVKKDLSPPGWEGIKKDNGRYEAEQTIEKGKRKEWIIALKPSGRLYSGNYGMYPPGMIISLFSIVMILFFYGLYRYRKFWIETSEDPGAVYIRIMSISKVLSSKARLLSEKGDSAGFYVFIFKGLQDYFAQLLELPSGYITEGSVKGSLRKFLQSGSLGEEISDVFFCCYSGKFSRNRPDKPDMLNTLEKIRCMLNKINERALEIIIARICEGQS